jgi:hypothetical protein
VARCGAPANPRRKRQINTNAALQYRRCSTIWRRKEHDDVSKQLTLSATISISLMAAFALFASVQPATGNEKGATTLAAAPAFEAAPPTS